MNIQDFKRLIMPLKRKIFLLLGRAILKAVNNAEGTQKIQIVALDGETITDMERFQEYGFETYPLSDSEVFAIFLNGNRDHGIALCVHDRRYRPKDLTQGEVAIYTDEDASTPFRIQMKRNRIHYRRSDVEDVNVDTSKTEDIGESKTETIGTVKTETIGTTKTENITLNKAITTPSEIHTNATEFIIVSPEISLGGLTFASLRTLIDSRFVTLFNTHTHTGAFASGPPSTPMSEANHATSQVRGI